MLASALRPPASDLPAQGGRKRGSHSGLSKAAAARAPFSRRPEQGHLHQPCRGVNSDVIDDSNWGGTGGRRAERGHAAFG